MSNHPPSIRGQILTARDHIKVASGAIRAASGCRNAPMPRASRNFCRRRTSAGSSWTRTAFCTPSRVRVMARSRRFFTPNGVAAFGARLRFFAASLEQARRLSRRPDYVKPHLPSPDNRGFTGMKYFRITRRGREESLRTRPRIAGGERTRAALPRRTRRAGATGRAAAGPSAHLSSRRMTRNCSATGGMKGRSSWIFSRANCVTSRRKFPSSRPANTCSGIRPIKSPRPARQAGAKKVTGACGSTNRMNGFIRTCRSRRSG